MQAVTTEKLCLDDISFRTEEAMPVIASAMASALNRLLQDSGGHPTIEVTWIPYPAEKPYGKIGSFQITSTP